MTATEFRLHGQLASDGFAGWVRDRADLLDLKGWARAEGPDAMTIVVAGPAAMIDAMEMACSLGPMDVLVDRIETRETVLHGRPNGFRLL